MEMLDLLLCRWSSGEGDDLIDAVVVKSTVGEVMVAAAVIVGGFAVVNLARVSVNGTTAVRTPGVVSPFGSMVRTERGVLLLAFEPISVEKIFVTWLNMGKVVAGVTKVESAASAVAKSGETCLMH